MTWMKKHEVRIQLTPEEIEYARSIGRHRSRVNDPYADGAIDPHRSPVEIDEEGAIGELAVAIFLQDPWKGRLWTRKQWGEKRRISADVGDCVQVKTVSKPSHRLLIPLKDHDRVDAVFVLVLIHALPTAILAGWCTGRFAIQKHRIDHNLPKPAYAVSPLLLGDTHRLKEYLDKHHHHHP